MDEMEMLAERVKAIYVKYRKMLHPMYKPSKKHDFAWPKIAKMLMENGFDAEAYIAAQFHERIGGYPYPNQLYSPMAIERFRKHVKHFAEDIRIKLQLELESFQVALERNDGDVIAALNDDTEDFTDLFKFCMARRYGVTMIPASWVKAARIQLATNPPAERFYKTVWENLSEDLNNAKARA